MKLSYEPTKLRPKNSLHREELGRPDMDLETARAERRSDLKSDETRAKDHCTARGLGACDNGAAIGQRAQRMDMTLIGARNFKLHWFGAGR